MEFDWRSAESAQAQTIHGISYLGCISPGHRRRVGRKSAHDRHIESRRSGDNLVLRHNGRMSQKMIWLGMLVGSTAGGYVPSLFGAGLFSGWGIFGSVIGGVAGVFAGYKLGERW